MKRIIALLSAIAMVLTMGAFCVSGSDDTPAGETEFPFADVPAARWSNPYVVMMYNEGIVGGVSANLFAPADNIKRSEFVKILCGVAVADTEGITHGFTDVVSGSWYEPYVAWAASEGIVNGVAPGKFAPDAKITRQDMATMIYRYVVNVLYAEPTEPEVPTESEVPTETVGLPVVNEPVTFTDDAKIADYAKEAVSAMQQASIIGGVGNEDGTFRFEPKSNATREQACKMLGELFLIINEDKALPEPMAPSAYLIKYDLNGGKAGWLKQVYKPTEAFTLPIPTREGFTFVGWSGTGINGVELTHTVIAGSVTGELNFKANFTPIEYTITYDGNGGVVDPSASNSYNVESATFTLPTPKRDGYEFLGWTGTGLNSATKSAKIKKGSMGNRSYKANWKALSKQATALDLLAGWVDDNSNYTHNGNNTVVRTFEYEGGEDVFAVINCPPTYADPMRRVQVEFTSISSGICFSTIITLGTKGTPTFMCEVSDANTGDVYMQSSNASLPKISENMSVNISWGYNVLDPDKELLSNIEEVMLMQLLVAKELTNEIYWDEIGKYGYDLSVFGL